jgi:hypothetical protein
MVETVWAFLKDGQNREILGWLGGGFVAVAGGLWAVFKFFRAGSKSERPATPTVIASSGGIAAGRDVRNVRTNGPAAIPTSSDAMVSQSGRPNTAQVNRGVTALGDIRDSHIVIGLDEDAVVKRITEAHSPLRALVEEARKDANTDRMIGAVIRNVWLIILYRWREAKRRSRLAS